ncbi:uncharacterized protein LOC105281870 isoform X3 [Ooceraea biroi]|uniref:uncharacterized protein LOC105281870 isoform X3 n=1 Tax=Ooceraea biroi TaxID=2015173 RepID=UPI0005BAFB9E|nr:uncharacterized protein LOC105281870 isoform X3 [Ooceraea biroi]
MDTQFLYIHRLSLVAIGLWPYHRTMLVQLQSSVFSFMLISYIIVQLTAFITTEWTLDFIVEILSTLFFLLLCAVQYNCFWINTHAVKRILDNLQYICSELRDDNEIAIIKRYGHIAKCIANGLTFQYIGGGTLLGSGIVLTGYFTYFCGLFNIASYRIKQAMQIINSDKICNWKNKRDIDKKISHAVDIHRTIIEFIEVSLYTFEGTYFLLIGLIVICLSLHLFGIFQAVCVVYNMADIVIHCSFAVGILVCSLGGNYVGQAVTDHYNDIFSTAYNIRWYITPVRVQRLILFLLQRGTKPYGIKLGGLYTLSLENFASVKLLYNTYIYSIHNICIQGVI